VFPLVDPLSSTGSAVATATLFKGFAGTTGSSDSHTRSSQDYRLGVPWASRPVITRTGGRGISRFSRMKVPYMPWFFDHAGSDGASR